LAWRGGAALQRPVQHRGDRERENVPEVGLVQRAEREVAGHVLERRVAGGEVIPGGGVGEWDRGGEPATNAISARALHRSLPKSRSSATQTRPRRRTQSTTTTPSQAEIQ
jgi:hypothetical protein